MTIASVPTGHDRLDGMTPTSVVAAWAGAADTVRTRSRRSGTPSSWPPPGANRQNRSSVLLSLTFGKMVSRFMVSLPPSAF
jgi:hypothetical protein